MQPSEAATSPQRVGLGLVVRSSVLWLQGHSNDADSLGAQLRL